MESTVNLNHDIQSYIMQSSGLVKLKWKAAGCSKNDNDKKTLSVGVVVRRFQPLCRFSRQSDSGWRNLSTGRTWRCA